MKAISYNHHTLLQHQNEHFWYFRGPLFAKFIFFLNNYFKTKSLKVRGEISYEKLNPRFTDLEQDPGLI